MFVVVGLFAWCSARQSLLPATGNVWWMKWEEWLRLPTVFNFTQIKIKNFKTKQKYSNRMVTLHKSHATRQIAPFFCHSIRLCAWMLFSIDCCKSIQSNWKCRQQIIMVWEPPIIQQKNSIHTFGVCHSHTHTYTYAHSPSIDAVLFIQF